VKTRSSEEGNSLRIKKEDHGIGAVTTRRQSSNNIKINRVAKEKQRRERFSFFFCIYVKCLFSLSSTV